MNNMVFGSPSNCSLVCSQTTFCRLWGRFCDYFAGYGVFQRTCFDDCWDLWVSFECAITLMKLLCLTIPARGAGGKWKESGLGRPEVWIIGRDPVRKIRYGITKTPATKTIPLHIDKRVINSHTAPVSSTAPWCTSPCQVYGEVT
jgi:hypothetical protein